MVRRVLVLVLLSLAAPAAAQAATVNVTGGMLRYAAAPGLVNNVTITESSGTLTLTRETGTDRDPFVLGSGCSGTTTTATCVGVTRGEIDLGDRSDRVTAAFEEPALTVTVPLSVTAGDGNDAIYTGTGNDLIRGGDGNDELLPNTGTDAISGGDGVDTAVYGFRNAPFFSLDAIANDGDADEKDLIGNDIENISGAARSVVTIVGDGRANRLTVLDGRGDITGGDGADVLEGGPLDDVIHARDGSPDTIICNGGVDTVEADTQDTVSPSCENVSIQATPGGAFDDKPPLLAWTAPGANASLVADQPTILRADASDDRGVVKVQFLDDDRVVCEDLAAPYECSFQPRGGDVGRNTLVVLAVDGANQTTTLVRAVTVRRFSSPDLSLALKPSRDRTAPYSFRATGKLERPATVAPSQGCSGRVVITAKRGSRTVSTTRASLGRTCEYAVTVKFRSKVSSRIRLTAKFEGNDVLASRSAASRTVRLG